MALTYTQQVAAFYDAHKKFAAEDAARDAEILASVKSLAVAAPKPPASEPAPPVVTEPPVPLPPAPAPTGRAVVYGPNYIRTRVFAQVPMARTPTELGAAKLILSYREAFTSNADLAVTYFYNGQYLGTPDIGTGGERPELGFIHEAIARFLAGTGHWPSVLALFESHGNIPVHFRHKNGVPSGDGTGDMLNLLDDPKLLRASCYYSKDPVGANPWFDITKSPVTPDLAHYPMVSYAAYLLTNDVFHLEELQHAATYAIIWGNPEYRGFAKCLLQDDQTRGYAWGLELVAQAYLATKLAESQGPLPNGLLPSSYWKRISINNALEFKRRWVDNGDKNGLTGCHFAVHLDEANWLRPWQQDFLGIVMGWMIYTGEFPEWNGNYSWHMRQAIDRASGKVGYPKSQATFYVYNTHKQSGVDGNGNPIWQVAVNNMAELATFNGLKETPDGQYPADFDGYYAAYLRANLKLGGMNGIAEAAALVPYTDEQARKKIIAFKYGF